MVLAGKKVLVIGLGRTGLAAADYLLRAGAAVRAADRRTSVEGDAAALAARGAELRLGEEGSQLLAGIDVVVPSPGVPRSSSVLAEAVRRSIPVLSEIELAFAELRLPLVAVTGTNGKSTTTTLLGEMFRRAGRNVFVGGNLGTPFIEAAKTPYELAVIEVSSFQLEWVRTLRPTIGVYLNLSEDHLDRYQDLAEYAAAKANLFARQTRRDHAVLNGADPVVRALAGRLASRAAWFDWQPVERGSYYSNGAVVYRDGGREESFALDRWRLPGPHNVENAMAAVAAARLWGLPPQIVQEALDGFGGLAHRLALVATKNGVSYFDDSKATNVDAVVKALASFTSPVVLLAGGLDKGVDFAPLRQPLREKVRKAIVFGQAREKIYRAIGDAAPVEAVATLQEAVQAAARASRAGDTVLLSPGCASFDEFSDYAHRGRAFCAAVRRL